MKWNVEDVKCDKMIDRPIYSDSVTNPVYELLFIHHQRSLAHHIDSCTTLTVAGHPRTTVPIIHGTDDAHTTDCTYHTQLIPICTLFISLGLSLCDRRVLYAHIATLADSYLTEPFVVVIVLPCLDSIPARVSWINPLPSRSDSVRTSFGLLLVYLDYLSALPCWILSADRRPTLALGLLSALSVLYLFATVWPCLWFEHVSK